MKIEIAVSSYRIDISKSTIEIFDDGVLSIEIFYDDQKCLKSWKHLRLLSRGLRLIYSATEDV